MTEEKLLLKIGKILTKLKIPYVITGGFAVSVWGKPRYTADIDVVIELLPEKLDKLAENLLLIDKNIYLSKEAMREALEKKGEFNFIHPQTGLKVDFWIAKDDFEKLKIKRRVLKKFGKQKIAFITPEDLILSKLMWYKESESSKQLEDIKSIFEISKVNLKYIKYWAKKQFTIKILKNLIKNI
jgi:hypothetical protein